MQVEILEPYVYASGTAVEELKDSVIAVSVSYTKSLQKVGTRTWRDIISYMDEKQFKLPRATRRKSSREALFYHFCSYFIAEERLRR